MRAATDRVSRWLYPRQWGLVALFFALYELTAENSFGLLEWQPCRRLAGMGMGNSAPKQGQHFGIYPQDVCSRRTAAGLDVESGRRVPDVGGSDAADFPAGRRVVGKGKGGCTGSAVEPIAAAPLEGWCGQ